MTADCLAPYDSQNLCVSYRASDPTPWKNGGNEYRLLFKTGDCVDLQLSPSGHKTGETAGQTSPQTGTPLKR